MVLLENEVLIISFFDFFLLFCLSGRFLPCARGHDIPILISPLFHVMSELPFFRAFLLLFLICWDRR